MAKSGEILGFTSNEKIEAKVIWYSTPNNANNQSTVTAELWYRRTDSDYKTYGTGTFSIQIGTSKKSLTKRETIEGVWANVLTHTAVVDHNDDGTGGVAISATGSMPDTSFAYTDLMGYADLDTIPRAATITSVSNINLNEACNVNWTPKNQTHRYKLKFVLGSWSYTTTAIHPNQTTAYTYTGYTIPYDVANQLPNVRVGKMTVTLYTYSDSAATTQIGSASSKTFTVTVPDNTTTKPKVTMSLSPVGSLPSAFAGLYIQGLTKVKAELSAEGKYGASITSYLMRVDGVYLDGDDAFTSSYFNTAGSRTVYGYATDIRGHTGEKLEPITVIPYSEPKLVNASAVRCDKDGNESESGTYLKITATRSYSPIVVDAKQKNFCKIMYRYSMGTSYSDWVTILDRDSIYNDTVTTGALLNGGLSLESSYTVQLRAIDDIGKYTDTAIVIPTDKVYWHRDGARNALGLGKYNERDNALDSAWDFYMNGHQITGLPTPTESTDAVPMSYVDPADIKIDKNLSLSGWYKVGTLSGNFCGVVTLTVGGVFMNNQASPSMVDIATQHNYARAFLRIPSFNAEAQIFKIGVHKESDLVYGVYAYYNTANENPVSINIHTHMGKFVSAELVASSVSESNMLQVVTLNNQS